MSRSRQVRDHPRNAGNTCPLSPVKDHARNAGPTWAITKSMVQSTEAGRALHTVFNLLDHFGAELGDQQLRG